MCVRPLQANFANDCEALSCLEINTVKGVCRSSAVNFIIDASPRDFEAALVNAVEQSGYRLRFRGYKAIPDPTTATGWNGPLVLADHP